MKDTIDFSKLINDAVNGDSSAFEELYRLTSKSAYHTASLLLKNREDIEDVLQNSYIKAYQKLPELKNPESFESWIKTIVENECKNYIKKEKRFYISDIFFKNKAEEHSEEWKQPVPQEYMEREELRKSIADIIDSLSPEVRACIILYHYEDKSLNEISELLNIPLGTVKSRLHNGRKKIEKEFDKLKKKDPTLYSLGAIPLILSLLAYQSKNIVVPVEISEGILASVSGTGLASAISTASGTGAVSAAAATTTASVAVKVTAVAVAGSVAVGGGVAVKTHIDNKSSEPTTAYLITYKEETCTVAESLTEILTTEEEMTVPITSGVVSTRINTSSSTSKTSAVSSAAQTSTRTTRPTTQKRTTTTRVSTTRETTTQKITTTKPTTTVPPTTSPENNYGASGGVITEYTGSDTYVTIPSSIDSQTVTAIGSGAFAGNTDIRSVSLPSTVTQIGQEAFADCTSLTSVSLPSSLENIGIGAFYGCTNLSSVSVPNGTKSIGDEAFAQCTSLSSVTIPSSVTSISDDAFDGCDSLTIRCEEGSAAYEYAVENGMNFVLI